MSKTGLHRFASVLVAFLLVAAPIVAADPSFRNFVQNHPAVSASYPTLVALALAAYRTFLKRGEPTPPKP